MKHDWVQSPRLPKAKECARCGMTRRYSSVTENYAYYAAKRGYVGGRPGPCLTQLRLPARATGDPVTPRDEKNARASVVAYLRHVATVEVGSILSPRDREVVDWCASWVENRLDEKKEQR